MTLNPNPYFEKYGGIFLGLLIGLVAYFFLKPLYNERWEHFMSFAFFTACGATVYLGVMLLINYNIETAPMSKIRRRELLYKHIIRHNLQVLILAIVVSLFTAFAINLNYYDQPEEYQKVLLCLIIFLLVWLVVDGYNLTKVYILIFRKYKNTPLGR